MNEKTEKFLSVRGLDVVYTSGRKTVHAVNGISAAAAYADHICAMNNDQVTVFGTTRDVMNDETLSHVFHTPVSVFDHSGRLLASYF